MATKIVKCPNCAAENTNYENYCRTCGNLLAAPFENRQMQQVRHARVEGGDKRIAAGICGILLGGFGIHKFILGYTNEGLIMLITYFIGIPVGCGVPSLVMAIVGIVEGIIYLTKSEEEFVQTYVIGKKGWF